VRHWWTEGRTITVSPAHLLAASLIMAIGLFALRGLRHSLDIPPIVPGTSASPAILAAARTRAPTAERPVQFVFVARDARMVTIAGDFNDWNPTTTPLKRAGADGVWSIVLPLSPGRHLYSFVVDGQRWVPDAEAPRAPENEFGTESSVVLVERGT
jgi:1,4-alpha-glucan branching enzyme